MSPTLLCIKSLDGKNINIRILKVIIWTLNGALTNLKKTEKSFISEKKAMNVYKVIFDILKVLYEFSNALYVFCHRDMPVHWWSCDILVSAGLCVSLISPGDLVVHCLPSSPLPLLITMSLVTNYSASYHNIATYSTNKQLFYFKAFWNFWGYTKIENSRIYTFALHVLILLMQSVFSLFWWMQGISCSRLQWE